MNTLVQPELLGPTAAAKYLGVSAGTLAVWRCTKRYNLPYIKIGAKIVYDTSDLLRFIQSRRVSLNCARVKQ